MKRPVGLQTYLSRGTRPLHKSLRGNEEQSTPQHLQRNTIQNHRSLALAGWWAQTRERAWLTGDNWGIDQDAERELWVERTFYSDADTGVTFSEAPYDGNWRGDEWWR